MGEMKLWWMVLVLLMVVWKLPLCAKGDPQVSCFFIFGDSLADNGNNNCVRTVAKVNYTPYGVDFPGGPSGRFCNGRTIFDVIAELLGFGHYMPPFAAANSTDILYGVNYASASAGILKKTGKQLGDRISFNMQLRNHRLTISRLVHILGNKNSTMKHLNKCLYSVGFGNNDYINNYFLPKYYHTSRKYTLHQFTHLLIQRYTRQLRTLYELGARKIALFGTGLLGCTPDAIFSHGNRTGCADSLNIASQLFNTKLISLVDKLNAHLTDAKFIYINSFGIGLDSSVLGLKNIYSECCPVGDYGQCLADRAPCANRSEYAFWDSFHPTEAVNIFTAKKSYIASNASYAYPFDIRHLVLLK